MAPLRVGRDELGFIIRDLAHPEDPPELAACVSIDADLACLSLTRPESLRLVLASGSGAGLLIGMPEPRRGTLGEQLETLEFGQEVDVPVDLDGPYLRAATVAGVDRWLQAPVRQELLAVDRILAELDSQVPQAVSASADRVLLGLRNYLQRRAPQAGQVLAAELLSALSRLQPLAEFPDPRLDQFAAQLRERVEAAQQIDRQLVELAGPIRERAITSGSHEYKWDPIDRVQVPARVVRLGLDGRDTHSHWDGSRLNVTVPAFGARGRFVPSERLAARLVDTETSHVISWCELEYDQSHETYTGSLGAGALGSAVLDERYLVDVYDAIQDEEPRVRPTDWPTRSALGLLQDGYTAHRLALADVVIHGTPIESRRRVAALQAAIDEELHAGQGSPATFELRSMSGVLASLTTGLDSPDTLRSAVMARDSRPTLAELDLVDEGFTA